MDIGVALTVFAVILPAELPDKTFIASLVLSTRYRALPVFLGAAVAFAVQSGIAVAAGRAVSLLPTVAVKSVSAVIFAAGAVLVLRGEDTETEREEVEAEVAEQPAAPSLRRVAGISFLVLFVAEWGDLTQLLTASFTAKYHDALAVFVGSYLALVLVAGLAVTGGRFLIRVLPMIWIRRIAAAAFASVAIVTALEAADVI
jgi:putative Ca2+/H+ antiporter (TMEM165/GDT1 family)